MTTDQLIRGIAVSLILTIIGLYCVLMSGCAGPRGYCQERAIYAGMIYARAGYPVRLEAGETRHGTLRMVAQAYKDGRWVYLYPLSLMHINESPVGDGIINPIYYPFPDFIRSAPDKYGWK